MPQPTARDLHADKFLTNISIATFQDLNTFVANQVFPTIPVDKRTDKYWVYTQNDWFRDEAQRRPDATESAGSGYTLGSDTFDCAVWAFHKDIGDQTRANADSTFNLDADAVRFVTQRLALRHEVQWFTDFFATSVWTTDLTGVTATPTTGQFIQWSDQTSSDPVTDIETGKRTTLVKTGYEPNTLVLGYDTYTALRKHPDIIERYKYTTSAQVGVSTLQELFGVPRILISKAIKATNAEGATAAYDFVASKSALLCYVNQNPGLLAPSAGYVFKWTGVSDGLGTSVGISKFRNEFTRSDRIEGQIAWDNKVVAADLGVFYTTAVA